MRGHESLPSNMWWNDAEHTSDVKSTVRLEINQIKSNVIHDYWVSQLNRTEQLEITLQIVSSTKFVLFEYISVNSKIHVQFYPIHWYQPNFVWQYSCYLLLNVLSSLPEPPFQREKKNAKKTATPPRIPASGTQDVSPESPPYFLSINRSQPADKAQVSNSIHNNKIPTNSILCCVSAHKSHDQLQHHIIVKILFALWLYRCSTYASGEHIAQCTSSAIFAPHPATKTNHQNIQQINNNRIVHS